MTTTSIAETLSNALPRRGLLDALLARLAEATRRHEEHKVVVALSRHDPHVLADMGFDPSRIYDAVDGTWDQVPQSRIRRIR